MTEGERINSSKLWGLSHDVNRAGWKGSVLCWHLLVPWNYITDNPRGKEREKDGLAEGSCWTRLINPSLCCWFSSATELV